MSVAGTVTWSQKLPYASKWVVIQDYVISFYICIVFLFHKLIIHSTLYVLPRFTCQLRRKYWNISTSSDSHNAANLTPKYQKNPIS